MGEPRATNLADAPTGEIVLEFSFDQIVRVEDAVRGWSRDEIAALLAGDADARAEMVGQAAYLATGSDSFDPDHVTVTINGREL